MKSSYIAIVVVIFVFLVGVGMYYVFTQQGESQIQPILANEESITEIPDPPFIDGDMGVMSQPVASENPADQPTDVNAELAALREGGSSYLDPEGLYSFLYPKDATLDSQENGKYIRIIKRGPSQRPQSEMSDGILVVFESINLEDQTLSQFIDARIQESTVNGVSELTSAKQSLTINNYQGFQYTLRGLGESTYFVVQKDAQSTHAVSITALVVDPEQRGYQRQVDAMFATLQLLK